MLTKVLLGLIALMLAAGPAVAQEVRDRSGLTEGGGDVGTSAFVPIPTGYTVIYFYTGAATSPTIESTVHCSNLLGPVTTVRVEVYGYTGTLEAVGALPAVQYNTVTWGIGAVHSSVFIHDALITPSVNINQGVIRILKKGTGRIICAAQIHGTGNPPAFMLPLVQYGPTGLH